MCWTVDFRRTNYKALPTALSKCGGQDAYTVSESMLEYTAFIQWVVERNTNMCVAEDCARLPVGESLAALDPH